MHLVGKIIYTTEACAALGHVYTLGMSFTRVCLHYRVLCFTWTCFLYRSLTCTWTSNGKTSLVHYRTLSFFAFRFKKKTKARFFS